MSPLSIDILPVVQMSLLPISTNTPPESKQVTDADIMPGEVKELRTVEQLPDTNTNDSENSVDRESNICAKFSLK